MVVPPEPVDNSPAEMEVSSSSEGSEMESDEESRELYVIISHFRSLY